MIGFWFRFASQQELEATVRWHCRKYFKWILQIHKCYPITQTNIHRESNAIQHTIQLIVIDTLTAKLTAQTLDQTPTGKHLSKAWSAVQVVRAQIELKLKPDYTVKLIAFDWFQENPMKSWLELPRYGHF